jgi:DNA-binding response OmpR family regulator
MACKILVTVGDPMRVVELVLVVDDDADLGAVLVDLLESHGLRAQQAGCGEEALAMLEAETPALVILDWFLPDGPPVPVANHCRDRGIPVVLSSAANDSHAYAGEIGAAATLPKPFDVDSFYRTVDELLRPRPSLVP